MLLNIYLENTQAKERGESPPYTILIVTHELNEAIFVGDRVVGLSQFWDWRDEGHETFPGATIVYDKVAPGQAGCGTVHFAPNSDRDYDWGNPRTVVSTADDWLNYPDLTGEKQPMNCAQWGNGDIREHHRWWLKRLPHVEGRTNGFLNNWWPYVTDFNRFPESKK